MIIVLSTATPECLLRIIDQHGDEHSYDWSAGRELARDLHAQIVAATGGDLRSVAGIAVHAGPGSFTGLRIGLTVVNTLAQELNVPIVGESGEGWHERALARLRAQENDVIVMPEYGAEARITTPKK